MDSSRQFFGGMADGGRVVRPSYYFMMHALLQSRVDLEDLARPGEGEEDLDDYVEHLTRAFEDPAELERVRSPLTRFDHEVLGRLERAADARLTYKIYRTPEDFLLLAIGVFDNPNPWLSRPGPERDPAAARRASEPTEEVVMGRGRAFYRFSYRYHRLVPRRRPVITEILGRFSPSFDRYARVLAGLRGEYRDLVGELSRGEIVHLERTVDRARMRKRQDELMDAFLDAYSTWRSTGDNDDRAQLVEAAAAVREMNPDFAFDLEDAERPGNLDPDHDPDPRAADNPKEGVRKDDNPG